MQVEGYSATQKIMCNSMKRLISFLLIQFSLDGLAQDSAAYSLYNSYYAAYKYILVEDAYTYSLDTTDKVFFIECKRKVPLDILKSLIGKSSKPFKWDKTKLLNTCLITDSTAIKNGQQCLRLSSPIFDISGTFALVHETYDTGGCINSGPILFHYQDKKWTPIVLNITSYHIKRGKIVQRQ